MENFSPELRLLLALLRSALGTSDAAPPPAGVIDWKHFLALVERHRVAGFLHRRARLALETVSPPEVLERLTRMSAATMQRALAQAAEQIRLVQLLDGAGIPVLAVKGLVLGQQLYGALGVRHVGDIDLLIPVADAERAHALLEAGGLRRTRPHFSLTPLQTKKYLQLKPEFEYQREAPPMRVELLWRLEGLREIDTAWSRAIPCQVAGRAMRTLPPDINALYLLQHGARHAWFRLFWLVDIALLLRDPALDWPALLTRARELRVERSLLQGAALAEELLGVPRPPSLLPRATEHRSIVRLAHEARRQIIREPQPDEGMGEWFRQAAYRVRLQPRARAKLATITPHLFSPLNWHTWPLPDRWFFLYYFATPFLWLWRRASRSR